MIAMSNSLGVNCTFCHNTREFCKWPESAPAARRGLARHPDDARPQQNYLEAFHQDWPANRLGPAGDGPKLYCATCHQGAQNPLLGVSLAKDWPELNGVAAQ